jgi:FecR protein
MKMTLRKSAFPIAGLVTFIALIQLVLAESPKQARVTDIVREVSVLKARATAHPAAINDVIYEGTAVRTGTESRAELMFTDQTLTRLGANTVFNVGAGARAYDLGSGAILMSAPKGAGTVKISTSVATCAVSGFTAILERHSNTWNKVLFLEGDGDVWLRRNPSDKRHMHSRQILIFPPNAKVLPEPLEFSECAIINDGLLIKGFKNKLPSWPLLVEQCQIQRTQPVTGGLIDPTNQNAIDQAMNAKPPPPMPRPTVFPSGAKFRQF